MVRLAAYVGVRMSWWKENHQPQPMRRHKRAWEDAMDDGGGDGDGDGDGGGAGGGDDGGTFSKGNRPKRHHTEAIEGGLRALNPYVGSPTNGQGVGGEGGGGSRGKRVWDDMRQPSRSR